jgi:Holliday junction resolvase RusA-like endonuclease
MTVNTVEIVIPEFPTHMAKTDNKYAPNKMIKLNNQSIYNGALNRFARAIVMNNMHEYLASHLEPALEEFRKSMVVYPVCIHLEVHTVVNHGSISMRKGKTCWKPAKEDYVPEWDIENLATIWIKALNDTLTKTGFLSDDNIKFVDCVGYKFKPVNDINERKLIIKIESS